MAVSPTVTSIPAVRSRLRSTGVALTAIVGLAALLRLALSADRSLPRYLPDEYLYPELARSLGNGDGIALLGQPTGFPALLEPLLLAPVWTTLAPAHAILATQALHALLMALAAVPVYALGRRLELSGRASLLCAGATAIAPGLFFASLLTAEALGYLLALTAVTLGVRALAEPSRSAGVAFLAAAALATGARLQYAVLFPAYLVAAPVVERTLRGALRRHVLVGGTLAVGLAAVAAGGSGVLGRWWAVTEFRLSSDTATWALSGAFILTAGAGVAIVPGAAAWVSATVARPTTRARAAFAGLAVALVGALLLSASLLTAETASDRFLERYLIVVAPLVVVAFACWLADGRSAALLAGIVALVLVVAAARVPFVRWTQGQGVADSPTLLALSRIERIVGAGDAGLIAAAIVTIGALVALASALRPAGGKAAATLAGALLVAITVGAHLGDGASSDNVRRDQFGADPSWVDASGVRDPLLVLTPTSSKHDAMFTLIMNRSIRHAAALEGRFVDDFDGLDPERLTLADDGRLLSAGAAVRRPVVWSLGGGAVAFDGARVTYDRKFALAIPTGDVRVGVLAQGFRYDGKLTQFGRVLAFPTSDGRCMRFSATLSVPKGVPPTTIETRSGTERRVLVVRSGRPATLALTSERGRRSALTYRTLRLGERVPTPYDVTVAEARYTAGPVACVGSQGS